MASPDDGLLPDEASGPKRVFEGDLVVPLMSPWLAFADLLRLAQTTDAGLIPLAQCWSLRGLELVAPHVTNEGISYVSRLNSFKLSSNDRVTPAAFVGLIRHSPHLTFIHCLSCKHLEKSSIFWHCYREFENDHLQCHHPAMQSMAWHVPESELRELPPAAAAALGYEFEEV